MWYSALLEMLVFPVSSLTCSIFCLVCFSFILFVLLLLPCRIWPGRLLGFLQALRSSDTCPIFPESCVAIDVPVVVTDALLHIFQICLRLPNCVSILQRYRERWFTAHEKLTTRCNVVTVEEIARNASEILSPLWLHARRLEVSQIKHCLR